MIKVAFRVDVVAELVVPSITFPPAVRLALVERFAVKLAPVMVAMTVEPAGADVGLIPVTFTVPGPGPALSQAQALKWSESKVTLPSCATREPVLI